MQAGPTPSQPPDKSAEKPALNSDASGDTQCGRTVACHGLLELQLPRPRYEGRQRPTPQDPVVLAARSGPLLASYRTKAPQRYPLSIQPGRRTDSGLRKPPDEDRIELLARARLLPTVPTSPTATYLAIAVEERAGLGPALSGRRPSLLLLLAPRRPRAEIRPFKASPGLSVRMRPGLIRVLHPMPAAALLTTWHYGDAPCP